MKYRGITYFDFLSYDWTLWLWKKLFCPRNIHLFDECESYGHYLSCDACHLEVHIAKFDDTYVGK